MAREAVGGRGAAYGLVLAGVLLPAAVLGDRIGRRRMLIAGLGVFGFASTAASLVDSPDALIACRAVLGLGGASAMPATLAIIGNVFSPAERARAISIWSGVAGLGAAAGPLAHGWRAARGLCDAHSAGGRADRGQARWGHGAVGVAAGVRRTVARAPDGDPHRRGAARRTHAREPAQPDHAPTAHG